MAITTDDGRIQTVRTSCDVQVVRSVVYGGDITVAGSDKGTLGVV